MLENSSGKSGSGKQVGRWVNFVLARRVWYCNVLWMRKLQKFYNWKTRILLSWQSLLHSVWLSCMVIYEWRDRKLSTSSQPDDDSSLPLETPRWPNWTKAMTLCWSLCAWRPERVYAEGGVVTVGWRVHGATQFHFEVSFKGDTGRGREADTSSWIRTQRWSDLRPSDTSTDCEFPHQAERSPSLTRVPDCEWIKQQSAVGCTCSGCEQWEGHVGGRNEVT